MDYDTWLTHSYNEALERSDAYIDWCEAHGLDPDDDTNLTAYEDEQEAFREEYEIEAYLHDKEISEREDGFYYEP